VFSLKETQAERYPTFPEEKAGKPYAQPETIKIWHDLALNIQTIEHKTIKK
jgi:hypothetical protein